MSFKISSTTHTNLFVDNLPLEIDQGFLEHYFRSHLDPPTCHVAIFRVQTAGYSKLCACVDLGNEEKIQQALDELNHAEINGKRMTLSIGTSHPSFSPGKKVYLRQIPAEVRASDVHDLLSSFGTVVNLELCYDQTQRENLEYACATFLTEEEAQSTIEQINSLRISDESTLAEPDPCYVRDMDVYSQSPDGGGPVSRASDGRDVDDE